MQHKLDYYASNSQLAIVDLSAFDKEATKGSRYVINMKNTRSFANLSEI